MNTINWKIKISGDEATVQKISDGNRAKQDELCHNIGLVLQETAGLTSLEEVQIELSEDTTEEIGNTSTEVYNASEHLVQVITSDFEGTLYPFALALGRRVEAYIKQLQQTDKLDSRLHSLDTEMHQMMTEIARYYARTGKWQSPD